MAKYGVGQPVRRTEDPRLLTGRGKFNDDMPRDGEAMGFVLRSPHAHADITPIRYLTTAGLSRAVDAANVGRPLPKGQNR